MAKKKRPHLVSKRHDRNPGMDNNEDFHGQREFEKTIPERLKRFDNAETHRKLDALLNCGDAETAWHMHFKVATYYDYVFRTDSNLQH